MSIAVIPPMCIVWKLQGDVMSMAPVIGTVGLLLQSAIGILPGCVSFRRRIHSKGGDSANRLKALVSVSVKAGLLGGLFCLWVWIPTKVTTSHTNRPDLMPFAIAYFLIGALYSGLTALVFAAGLGQSTSVNRSRET